MNWIGVNKKDGILFPGDKVFVFFVKDGYEDARKAIWLDIFRDYETNEEIKGVTHFIKIVRPNN